MNAFFTIALVVVLIFVQIGNISHAQNKGWRVHSPPGRGFSVEVPAPLRRVKSFDGEHGVDFDPDQDKHGIFSYAAIENTPEDCRFGIIVLNGRAKNLLSLPRKETIDYLSVILIGDDDDSEPESVKDVRVNGLVGRDYLYVRDERKSAFGSTGSIHTRGRIFDTGSKIYVLVFVGQDTTQLTSPDAERFLNSFRLRRQKRKS